MKKVLLFLLAFSCCSVCDHAAAQKRTPVFSPALFGSQPYDSRGQTRVKRPAVRETQSAVTFLYFNNGQTELTKEMKEQLVPVLKRLSSGETSQITAVGVSRSQEDSRKRLNRLAIFLRDYKRDVEFQARVVDSKNVIDNNNVVQIIEKK